MNQHWRKQQSDTPLFPDIEWNKPERRDLAGRLGIIGGNKLGFAAAADAYEIAKKYIENMDEVEAILRENIHSWKVERVGKTEISAIRVATVEMLNFDDVPPAVSINEAVEIAKKFSDEKSYRFVNKVLKNVLEAIKEI